MAIRIRVLIADDNALMRAAVEQVLSADPRIEVVGQARDGQDAVEQAAALRPDVITMDFQMPRLNGAEAIREIFRDRPRPVVMLTEHAGAGARETVEGLAAGAVDFVAKPAGDGAVDLAGIAQQLVEKVLVAAGARPLSPLTAAPATEAVPTGGEARAERTTVNLRGPELAGALAAAEARIAALEAAQAARATRAKATSALEPVVIITLSTGGQAALERVLPRLPADFPAGVLIVQNLPGLLTAALAERLDRLCPLRVREAREGDRISTGTVLVAPGDYHVVVDEAGGLKLEQGPAVNGCRPSADVTFESAAAVYGGRMIGVAMTGVGNDGALGLAAVRAASGRVVAQDRETSAIWEMPRAAIEGEIAHDTVGVDLLAPLLRSLAEGLT